MYFLRHPLTFIDYLIAKFFVSDITFYLAAVLFLAIAFTYEKKYFIKIDNDMASWVDANQKDSIKSFLDKSTIFGNAIFHIIFSLISAIYFYTINENAIAASFMFVLIFSWGLNRFLKLIFRRERPVEISGEIKKRISFSFPSGHVMASLAIYFFSAVIFQAQFHLLPWFLIVLLVFLIIFITRVYLSHHYFTDVLAGFFMGIICLKFSIWFYFLISQMV